jgi:hypothetical protein
MTRYTVVWVRSARDELAEFWLNASDRESVAVAANTIDQELAVDPSTKGVAVHEGIRGYFCRPLRVLFAARENDRIVEVLRVKRL